MDNLTGSQTALFLKRQAKNLKKQQGISHNAALDQAARMVGFHNWNHFVNTSKTSVGRQKKRIYSAEVIFNPMDIISQRVSPKIGNYRKLLIAGMNELLNLQLISLNAPKNSVEEHGHVFLEIFGYPSVVMWSDIGFEELRISVWWKYNHSLHPQANLTGNYKEKFNCASPLAKRQHYKKFVGITASGWLERRTGKYLQGKNNSGIFEIYTRRGEKEELEKFPIPQPKGYKIEGKFHI